MGVSYERGTPVEQHLPLAQIPNHSTARTPKSHPFEDTLLSGSAAILCTGGLDVIRKEAWSFYRTIFGVRLCWELEEPKGPKKGGLM